MAVHTGTNGSTHGDDAQQVDKDGNCPDCAADNLNPDTGKYGYGR